MRYGQPGAEMRCAYCNALKPWGEEHFPVYYYAECRACVEARTPNLRGLLGWLLGPFRGVS